jgi:mono/diheme cytochrome c family protein
MPQLLMLAMGLLALTGCRQQMANQPAYRPFQPSSFFADGRSARPLVEGTVPRGELRLGPFFTGRKPAGEATAIGAAALIANPSLPNAAFDGVHEDHFAYLDALPFAQEKLGEAARRGQERFNIYCAPCHDRVGTGRGMIVQRGYTQPPSLHTDLSRGFLLRQKEVALRRAPVGYYFDVVTNGFGAMPAYGKQISPADRWAIIAYVRVLQLSQDASLEDVRDGRELQKLLSGKEPPR